MSKGEQMAEVDILVAADELEVYGNWLRLLGFDGLEIGRNRSSPIFFHLDGPRTRNIYNMLSLNLRYVSLLLFSFYYFRFNEENTRKGI